MKDQKINCDVHDCTYCNCDIDKCELNDIKVSKCDCGCEKEDTMCASYEEKED